MRPERGAAWPEAERQRTAEGELCVRLAHVLKENNKFDILNNFDLRSYLTGIYSLMADFCEKENISYIANKAKFMIHSFSFAGFPSSITTPKSSCDALYQMSAFL